MVRNLKLTLLCGLLALAVAALLPGRIAVAQAPEGDPLARFSPALLPDFAGDMDAHADAPRYTIEMTLALDSSGATLDGRQQVRYTNRTPHTLERIVFRLYPNLESYGGEMTVLRVSVDGAAAPADLDATGTVLSVPLAAPLAPGERATLTLDYALRVQAGHARLYKQFSYLDDVLALPNAYPVLSVYEPGDGWWEVADHTQGDAVYSETAFFEVTLRAPEDLIVAASGTEISVSAAGEGLLEHRYVAPLMRDFTIVAAPHFVTRTGTVEGVTITLYYDPARPNAEVNATAGLRAAQAAVHLFNSLFGAYPFAELDIVQTPTTAGGIEYPGLIVIGADAWDENGDRSFLCLSTRSRTNGGTAWSATTRRSIRGWTRRWRSTLPRCSSARTRAGRRTAPRSTATRRSTCAICSLPLTWISRSGCRPATTKGTAISTSSTRRGRCSLTRWPKRMGLKPRSTRSGTTSPHIATRSRSRSTCSSALRRAWARTLTRSSRTG